MATSLRLVRAPLRQLTAPASVARTPLRRCLQPRISGSLPSLVSSKSQSHKWAPMADVLRPLGSTAFHTSSKQLILPPPPQSIEGTVNDPVVVPNATPAHGSYHWAFERLISAALIPLTIAPFAAGTLNPTLDAIFCATILIHSHIGFESIIIDYIPVKEYPRARKIFMRGLQLATITVAIGLYEFETNDVGITEAVKRIWIA